MRSLLLLLYAWQKYYGCALLDELIRMCSLSSLSTSSCLTRSRHRSCTVHLLPRSTTRAQRHCYAGPYPRPASETGSAAARQHACLPHRSMPSLPWCKLRVCNPRCRTCSERDHATQRKEEQTKGTMRVQIQYLHHACAVQCVEVYSMLL